MHNGEGIGSSRSANPIERLILPVDQGYLEPLESPSLVIGGLPSPALEHIPEPLCVQSFKPYVDSLEARGIATSLAPVALVERSFVKLSRFKGLNRFRFAQAWAFTQTGGHVVVSGDKTEGVESLIKELKKHLPLEHVLPKSHGKVFWVQKTDAEGVPAEWLTLADPQTNKDGYKTASGIFSSDKIDLGSAQLADTFDETLKGNVADLGAGWGYLSHRLLATSEKVKELHLFEAEATALEMAKLNVTDQRASFHWEDVAGLKGFDNSFDLVISNPPFHETRKSEPDIGKAFIETAARILRSSGRLLMVANRQLPYEETLDQKFRSVEKLSETKGYKIIMAKNPRPRKLR